MKIILSIVALLGFFGLISYSVQKTPVTNDASEMSANERAADALPLKNKAPVLVELFTSEGCSSCPPADKTLIQLEKEQANPQAEIITLALHVDYWNRLGWTDEFSSPMFSQRQELYGRKFQMGSVYTPQMVVDGTRQFVGSDFDEANKAISESAKTQKAKIELAIDDDKLKVKISEMPAHENASIFLAIAEDNLETKVKSGENGGRTLRHVSVVRELKSIGNVVSENKDFEIETVVQTQSDWKRENLKAVVFVQENQSRKILGVNRISIGKK